VIAFTKKLCFRIFIDMFCRIPLASVGLLMLAEFDALTLFCPTNLLISSEKSQEMKNLISFVIVAHLVSSTDAFQSARNVSLRPIKPPKLHSKSAFQRNNHDRRQKSVYVTTAQSKLILQAISANTYNQPPFSLPTALFLAGLAFNAYTEPPPNSSRWERGSSGLNVAFLSSLYTRSLYSGIIEVTPLKASDLPDEDDAAESLITGGGVDASLLVGVVEGAWSEDVKKLEKEQFHNG
jgi:hypothetical protein